MQLILRLDRQRRAEVAELLLAVAGLQVNLLDNRRHELPDVFEEDFCHLTHKCTSTEVLLREGRIDRVVREVSFLVIYTLFGINGHVYVLLRSSDYTNVPKS